MHECAAHPALDVGRLVEAAARTELIRRLEYLEVVDSTNRVGRRLVAEGASHRTFVFAEYQTEGRGRGSHPWLAPPRSSVLFSGILRPPPGSALVDMIMLASLAVADAIFHSVKVVPVLKWPNDVLIRGRKVAGILAETSAAVPDGLVILGVGINVNISEQEIRLVSDEATSLQIVTGASVDREHLIEGLFRKLDLWYRVLTQDATAIYTEWSARLAVAGQRLQVSDHSGKWTGTAVAVQRDGGLCIQDSSKAIRTIYAADVSTRPL